MGAPDLTSFGALVRFALRLEARAAAYYAKLTPFSATAGELSAQHRARVGQIERARQQFLNEVVLEPVSGLDPRTYLEAVDESEGVEGLPGAIVLERAAARFYEDSARVAGSVLAEASRVFRKLAEGNRANVERLEKEVR